MVRAVLVVALTTWLVAACGGSDGAPSSPVTEPSVLRLVAMPSIGSVDSGARIEAVLAYPERVTGAEWQACVLLVDDPASVTGCPIPMVPLQGWTYEGRFRTQLDTWTLQSVGNLGAPLFEALSQVAATNPALLGGCAADVVTTYDACVIANANWPEQCAWSAHEQLRPCVLQGGTAVRVQLTATLDDTSTLVATRRLRFEKTGSPAVGNRNPVLFNVEIDGQVVPNGESIQVPVGTTVLLRPTPFAQSGEDYTDAGGVLQHEILSFSWVRTGGDLCADLTSFDDPVNSLFVPQDAVGPLTLWVFFEDNRGGIDWTRVGIDPVPTP